MPPANHLLVRNADWDPDLRNTSAEIPDKIAICVKPIHFYYNQVKNSDKLADSYVWNTSILVFWESFMLFHKHSGIP